MPQTKNKRPVTTDDQIRMTLRWNINHSTSDALSVNANVWKDTRKAILFCLLM